MDERNIRLHFEGPKTSGHTLPSDVLVRALENIQQIVYLLAKQERGDTLKQRTRVNREIENTFSILCKVPENGGYAIPQEIGDTSYNFFDIKEIITVASKFHDVSEAIESNDAQKVARLIPDRSYRSAILKKYKAAQPPRRSGLVLSIEDYKNAKILGGKDVLTKIEYIEEKSKDHNLGDTPGYLIGTLVKMDFLAKSMSIKLLSGRAIQAIYQDDFESTLLENARGEIQIHGNIQYDEKNEPSLISDVDSVTEIDLSPVVVEQFECNNSVFNITPPMTFEIDLDRESGLMSSSGDFNIDVIAETRGILEDEIEEALIMLCIEYALEDDNNLSPKAIEFANGIRSRISEKVNNEEG